MHLNREKIIKEYNLRNYGNKGWLSSPNFGCPHCGRRTDFGLIINEDGPSSYHCFSAKCGEKGSLFKLLLQMGRRDLFVGDFNEVKTLKDKIELDIEGEEQEEDLQCVEIEYPMGFRLVEPGGLRYLNNRGWTEEQYKLFSVGKCTDPYYKNYLLFCLKEDGKLVGFLGRSQYSKEWHKENERKAKLGEEKIFPRYKNSKGVDFDRVIGGIDELTNETKQILVVEGVMDKTNLDRILHLYEQPEIKCVFTNGAKLSEIQAKKLKRKGIKSAILMYDDNTIQQTQQCGMMLSRYISNVKIAEIKGEKDPGDFNEEDFENVMKNLYNPIEYKIDRLTINFKM